jgi:hypothetical protein
MRKYLGLAAAALLLLAVGAAGQTLDQVLAQTGLDRDLVTMLTVEQGGQKFLLVFVYINERTLSSKVKPEIAEKLAAYVGKNAVLVWAYSESGAALDPSAIWFSQGQTRVVLTAAEIVPLEGDLLSGSVPAATPVVAIVVLGEAIDPAQPFEIHYGDMAMATLAVQMGTQTAQAQASATVQGQGEATAQAEATSQAQATVESTASSGCPCGQAAAPCGCDPCAWLSGWWSGCCGQEASSDCGCCCPGFLPFLLLLLLGH